MIFDLEHDKPSAADRADVCVIGAGAAGIALSVELVRLGRSVLLLEGGGRGVEDRAQEPYRSEVAGNLHRGIHTGRFRALGGTTTRWGGQILELNSEDFTPRDWIAGGGWPIAKKVLQPFYERALALEGLSEATMQDAAVWRKLRQPQPEFADFQSYLTRWCPEPDFARLHSDSLHSPAIRVWLHANAVELIIENDIVKGVRCRTQTGVEATFRADEFVFCLGAIECSRFFLQPRENGQPWDRSGLLGKYFQDHIDANVARVVPRNRERFAALWDNIFLSGFKYHPKIRLAPELQARERTLNCGATMAFASETEEHAAAIKETAKHLLRGRFGELSAGSISHALRHAPLLLRQTLRYMRQHRAFNPADSTISLRLHCEQEPLSESSITLAGSTDSLGLRRARLDWRIANSELRTLQIVAATAAESLSSIAEVSIEPALLACDAHFRSRCDDSNHHMGGMRMHDDANRGVVSSDLRLHGTRNCFVCSGAVFPSSGFSNPTHTVLALAMRLAQHLSR